MRNIRSPNNNFKIVFALKAKSDKGEYYESEI